MYYLYDYQKTDTPYRFICIKFENNIMSKAISYYDWQQSFRDNTKSDKILNQDNTNSLGISENNFKDFIKKWREKNLN